MRSNRPTGVTLVAIYSFLAGVPEILLALSWLFLPLPGQTGTAAILIGLPILASGILYIAVGWGLLELRNWARITAIVLHALSLISCLILGAILLFGIDFSALDPFVGRISFPGVGLGFWIFAVISGVIIWYLLTPDVERAFVDYSVSSPAPYSPSPLPPTIAESYSPPPAPRPVASPAPRPDPTRLVDRKPPVTGWLVVRSGPRAGKQLGLSTSVRNTIGRDGTRCDLIVDDPAASAEHARVQWEHGQFVLYDLASSNGTWVNNRRVQRQPLLDNDVVRVGDTKMVFKLVR